MGKSLLSTGGHNVSEFHLAHFLQDAALKDFNLQESDADKVSIQWSSEKEGGIITNLTDHREQFTSDSLAKEFIETQKKLTISDDFGLSV